MIHLHPSSANSGVLRLLFPHFFVNNKGRGDSYSSTIISFQKEVREKKGR